MLKLGAADPGAPGFDELRRESQEAGLRMLVRLGENWADGSNRFDRPGEVLPGAWMGADLVGIGGRNADPFILIRARAA